MDYLTKWIEWTKRPMKIVANVFGGGYLAVWYVRSKVDGMQDSLTRTRASQENLRRRFEQNQEDCSFTVEALIPTLGKQVVEMMNVEGLVEVLNRTKTRGMVSGQEEGSRTKEEDEEEGGGGGGGLVTKDGEASVLLRAEDHEDLLSRCLVRPDGSVVGRRSEIWREMMLVSFSRLFTCLYGLSLLTLQTYVQLGLLGRDEYLSSLRLDGMKDEERRIERGYLTFSYWYLHHGWLILANRIRLVVEEMMGSKSLKDLMTGTDLLEIFESIRDKVEFETDGSLFNFRVILLPKNSTEERLTLEEGLGDGSSYETMMDIRLRHLLDETQDFMDCPDFGLVLSSVMDGLVRECYDRLGLDNHQRIRLVEILPLISRESLEILNGIPNQYLKTMTQTVELKEFSSVIYTSYSL